jgi:protein-S-isoprenylcysteine O-methyltransferase Ste14
MPPLAFILLAVVCVAILGFACACLSEQPAQALERVVSTGSALPPLIEVWSLVFVAFVGTALLLVEARRAPSRASPVVLQRFLF